MRRQVEQLSNPCWAALTPSTPITSSPSLCPRYCTPPNACPSSPQSFRLGLSGCMKALLFFPFDLRVRPTLGLGPLATSQPLWALHTKNHLFHSWCFPAQSCSCSRFFAHFQASAFPSEEPAQSQERKLPLPGQNFFSSPILPLWVTCLRHLQRTLLE